MPDSASAILLLPSGHRAYDETFTVALPVPETLDVHGRGGVYHLFRLHHGGAVDAVPRALYVLGGEYRPGGFTREDHHAPDEAHDQ